MNLLPWRKKAELAEERSSADPLISMADYLGLLQQFSFQGVSYTLPGSSQEEVSGAYRSLARYAYKANGVVFACMLVRATHFSEARFQFRRIRNGRPGDLWGNSDLAALEKPWPGATTGDLLAGMLQHADLGGNAFITNRYGGMRLLRPDWVTMVVGSQSDPNVAAWDPQADVLGYIYEPGGPRSGRDPVRFDADEVAHFKPIPDPEAQFRGMSWLTPLVREIMADKAATDHKLAFFEKGATPNLVVKFAAPNLDEFKTWIDAFREGHEGAANAYKTIFLANGADATVVGADLRQLDFKMVQGAGETRVAAAANVPPIIVGLSEGLQAATYSNYAQARRRFADGTMRPLWRNAAGSLAHIVNVPGDSELWYDDSGVSFLKEDLRDAAAILGMNAITTRQLTDAGFTPESVVAAVSSGDLKLLQHTGLFSVQLQPPGAILNGSAAAASASARDAIEMMRALVGDRDIE